MSDTLTDYPFDDPFDPLPATMLVTDPAVVEAQYAALNERRAAAERAGTARRNAATARQVAQSFSEYARAFRKVAETKGSPVDHCVAVDLADYCERQVVHYTAEQARCTTVADRAGSI
jgi:hypothetical protein